jgi:2-aminoadipate transaminase
MRLNFSGVTEDEIREGIRRIGKVIEGQVGLYGALTGERPHMPAAEGEDMGEIDSRSDPSPSISDSSGADSTVVPFRRTGEAG